MRVVGVGRLLKIVNGAQEVQISQSRCRPQRVAQYWVLSNLLVSPPPLRAGEGKKNKSFPMLRWNRNSCVSVCACCVLSFLPLLLRRVWLKHSHSGVTPCLNEKCQAWTCEKSSVWVLLSFCSGDGQAPSTECFLDWAQIPCSSTGITLIGIWRNEDW